MLVWNELASDWWAYCKADLILTNRNSEPVMFSADNCLTILGRSMRSACTFIIDAICLWGSTVDCYRILEFYLMYLCTNDEKYQYNNQCDTLHDFNFMKQFELRKWVMTQFLVGSDEE